MEITPYLTLRWEKAGNQRYYEIYLARDLFGWCLTCVWGRRGMALGRIIHYPCDSYADGLRRVALVRKQRRQKHYQLVLQIEH